jgi:hypothetical protein
MPMLGPVALWFVTAGDKRGLMIVGGLLLFMALATLVWNVVS